MSKIVEHLDVKSLTVVTVWQQATPDKVSMMRQQYKPAFLLTNRANLKKYKLVGENRASKFKTCKLQGKPGRANTRCIN